jgi:hypothetical protein
MTRLQPACLLALVLLTGCVHAQDDAARPLVVVAMAPVYQLALPLLADTGIDLQLLPDEARSMQTQTTLFTRQAGRFAATFARADAVLGISRIWPGDPLYTTARGFNIRVVPIDASQPWSHELDGVSRATSPVSNSVSPWFWLSLSNVIRMLDIIGYDLQALYPAQASTIRTNLEREKNVYVQMKAAFENRFIAVDDPVVYALAEEFVYLTSDLGIFVDAWFVRQDIDWTTEDYRNLTSALQSAGIGVVLHKWEPAPEIRQAITAGGATLVVLDTLETTTDFRAGFERNLAALLAAFGAPAP